MKYTLVRGAMDLVSPFFLVVVLHTHFRGVFLDSFTDCMYVTRVVLEAV